MTAALNGVGKVVRVVVAGLAALMTLATSAAAPEPIENFTKQPSIDEVAISPSGKRLAVLVFGTDGYRRLGVMDLDPIGKPRVVASFGDGDINSVSWVNDDRLVYSAAARGSVIFDGKGGTFAVNHDGSDPRHLIAWRRDTDRSTGTLMVSKLLPYGWFVRSTIDDGSNDVFVYKVVTERSADVSQFQLARLNTSTGALRSLSYGMPEGTQQWLLDAKHEPRAVTTYRAGRTQVFWRGKGGEKWDEVADFDALKEPGISPWFVDDAGQMIVLARVKSDTTALYKFDPVAKRIDPEPVVKIAGFDLDPRGIEDSQTGRLVGVRLRADRPISHWFDEGLQRIQNGVDAALPGRTNRLYCGRCESTRFFVIGSSSDRQPVEYFLFDRSKSSLESIGASRPWIDAKTQGRRSAHLVNARDGLPLPVYVTHPVDAATDALLPAVVLVHGGPFLRGSDLSWQARAQFLASRGYRVLEPEFRGSAGYGERLFKAGWRQWGREMQDDLVDTVKWAAEQRLIDPAKVCIIGSSYGGYAALMAPIATPGVFRCAASFAGVTDIDLMYSITWSDTSDAARTYSMPTLIGDPVKDADRLAAASPLKRVAEIKIPLLVAHGGDDRRVPIEHERKFVAAARKSGVSVEQVEYLEEGHGFFNPANEADYLGRLERFLEKSLASPR